MNKNLEAKLVAQFPIMFSEYGGDKRQTCMAWGCECGDGWFPLLWALCVQIEGYYKSLEFTGAETPPPVVFTQIKEKFGTLNVYYSGGDSRVRDFISFAETMSMFTCEQCGSTTGVHRRKHGWINHACYKCVEKNGEDIAHWEPVIKEKVPS